MLTDWPTVTLIRAPYDDAHVQKDNSRFLYSLPLFVIQNLPSIEGVENASLNKLINRIKLIH